MPHLPRATPLQVRIKTKNHKIKGQTFIRHGLHTASILYTKMAICNGKISSVKKELAKILTQSILHTPITTSIN